MRKHCLTLPSRGLIQATPILCIEQMYAPRCPRCYRFIGRCLQLLEAISRSSLATQWRSRYWIKNTGASYLFMRAIPALAPVTLPKHDKKGCYQLSEAVNVANSDPEENTNQRTLVRCNSSGRAGLNPFIREQGKVLDQVVRGPLPFHGASFHRQRPPAFAG